MPQIGSANALCELHCLTPLNLQKRYKTSTIGKSGKNPRGSSTPLLTKEHKCNAMASNAINCPKSCRTKNLYPLHRRENHAIPIFVLFWRTCRRTGHFQTSDFRPSVELQSRIFSSPLRISRHSGGSRNPKEVV